MNDSIRDRQDTADSPPSREIRILALDLGARRIGVAISDGLGLTAHGLPTLERKNMRDDIRRLHDVIEAYGVTRVVVGLPRNMDGSLGPQAGITMDFIDRLRKAWRLKVVTWDERLSTRAAERVLLQGDVSRSKRRKKVDQVAAVLILQGYLDSHRESAPP